MTASKKERLKEARQSLGLANEQLENAQVASWDPPEAADCVTNAFYAYENALTAAMLAVGRKRTHKHPEKAAGAKQLYEENRLKTDVSERLRWLNDVRKDVQYGHPGFELADVDLEEVVSELESSWKRSARYFGTWRDTDWSENHIPSSLPSSAGHSNRRTAIARSHWF